jgi:hypothetical protein
MKKIDKALKDALRKAATAPAEAVRIDPVTHTPPGDGDWARELGAPERYWDKTPGNWQGLWPDEIGDWQFEPWSVTLLGGTGVGKTHLATALFNDVLKRMKKERRPAHPGFWFDVTEALDKVRQEIGALGVSQTKERLLDKRLLLLDDLGAERPTEFALDTLRAVLTFRYNHLCPTIITSNAEHMSDLEKFDVRVTSRLAEGIVIELAGADKRLGWIEE